ncbi:MAG: hypothetical protein ACSLFP_08305 [Acidimicrobiales bacterium]
MSTDDLEDRLGRLGQAPIAPEVAATHRHTMAQVASEPPRARFGWRAVALAAVVGFFAGSTALASAGSLPGPAQDIAHNTLGAVGIDVPRSTEGCPDGSTYRNHGEYVSAVEAAGGDVSAAAKSDCGKPAHAGKGKPNGNGKDKGAGAAPGAGPDRDGDPCTGPPPWAGTKLDAEAKDAARAEREATCGPDDDADEVDDAEEDDSSSRSGASTTVPVDTTLAPETTTTASDTTTTTEPEATTTTQP